MAVLRERTKTSLRTNRIVCSNEPVGKTITVKNCKTSQKKPDYYPALKKRKLYNSEQVGKTTS